MIQAKHCYTFNIFEKDKPFGEINVVAENYDKAKDILKKSGYETEYLRVEFRELKTVIMEEGF